MFQFSGLGISLTKPHGEKMNVLLRATSLRPPVFPVDGAAEPDGAVEAAPDAAADGEGDVVVPPHAATSNPTIASPDSQVAALLWRARRGPDRRTPAAGA
jgi:hypothetical protein